jgi:hypothetical protein
MFAVELLRDLVAINEWWSGVSQPLIGGTS